MKKIKNIVAVLLISNSITGHTAENISNKRVSENVGILNYERKGEYYLNKNRLDKAEKIYKKLLKKTEGLKGNVGLSAIYFQKKDYDGALKYSEKALEIYSNLKNAQGSGYSINDEREYLKARTLTALSLYRKGKYKASFEILFEIYSEIYDLYSEENIKKFENNLISLNEKIKTEDIFLYNENLEKINVLEFNRNDWESLNLRKKEETEIRAEKGENEEKKEDNLEQNTGLENNSFIFPSLSSEIRRHPDKRAINVTILGNEVKVSTENAKKLAFENAKLSKNSTRVTKLLLEKENRRYVYNMIFFTEDTRYEYKIDANSGEIIKIVNIPRKLYAQKVKIKGFLNFF